MNINTVDMT